MTAQEILQLMQGGFTHDEIIALTQTSAAPAPDPVPAPAPAPELQPSQADEPAPAPVPAPAPASAQEPAPAADQPDMVKLVQGMLEAQTEMQRQMANLTSAIQANAIANSQIPGGNPNPPDAAAALAEIIRPSRKGGK